MVLVNDICAVKVYNLPQRELLARPISMLYEISPLPCLVSMQNYSYTLNNFVHNL